MLARVAHACTPQVPVVCLKLVPFHGVCMWCAFGLSLLPASLFLDHLGQGPYLVCNPCFKSGLYYTTHMAGMHIKSD